MPTGNSAGDPGKGPDVPGTFAAFLDREATIPIRQTRLASPGGGAGVRLLARRCFASVGIAGNGDAGID